MFVFIVAVAVFFCVVGGCVHAIRWDINSSYPNDDHAQHTSTKWQTNEHTTIVGKRPLKTLFNSIK